MATTLSCSEYTIVHGTLENAIVLPLTPKDTPEPFVDRDRCDSSLLRESGATCRRSLKQNIPRNRAKRWRRGIFQAVIGLPQPNRISNPGACSKRKRGDRPLAFPLGHAYGATTDSTLALRWQIPTTKTKSQYAEHRSGDIPSRSFPAQHRRHRQRCCIGLALLAAGWAGKFGVGVQWLTDLLGEQLQSG